MIDLLGPHHSDVIRGEDAHLDILGGLVIAVAVSAAVSRLAPPVQNLSLASSSSIKECVLIILIPEVALLAVGEQAALPVPVVVVVDVVDGEEAHVVQS